MIKNILILLIALIFTTCSPYENKYSIPTNDDINSILKTIIYRNHLPVLKYRKVTDTIYDKNGQQIILSKTNFPLNMNLEKFNVLHIIKDTVADGKLPAPPPPNSIILDDLLSVQINGQNFFNKSDSSYFFFLNENLKAYKIPQKISSLVLKTTNSKEWMERKLGNRTPYFTLSIPIFSQDNKKAYIIVGFHCLLCGYAKGIYLKKQRGSWEIVKIHQLWVS